MTTECDAIIPFQRALPGQAELVENQKIAQAAAAIMAGRLIMWENGPVMALAGDANNPDMPQAVSKIKGDRSPNQPLGWITPFGAAIEAFDLSVVTDKRLLAFLENPDEMTRRLGALSFLRSTANMNYKTQNDISDALIPKTVPGQPASTVQLYSPTTNNRCSRLVRYAAAHGVRMAMTSANYHGEKEIVTYEAAKLFAKEAGDLMFLPQYKPELKPLRPRGSYPVISVLPDRLKLIRFGFVEPQLLADVLHDLPIDISPGLPSQEPKHPEHVLRKIDLSPADRQLKGTDLHDVIVDSFMRPPVITL
ncbi:MAG: hypothetical protein QFB87_01550 [Patescibacteria group bacterium]|nr:hypothetical protein [Patescibacteria group bacterium]